MAGKWSPWQYVKNYKFKSLFLSNFLLILLVIFVPMWIFCIAIFSYFRSAYAEEINGYAYDDLMRVQETIDTVGLNIQSLMTSLAADSSINEIVRTRFSEKPTFDEAMQLRDLARNIVFMGNEYIESIYIFSYHNQYVMTMNTAMKSDVFYDMGWLEVLEKNTVYGGGYMWGRIQERAGYESAGLRTSAPCITIGVSIPVVKRTVLDGYIVVNMDNRWIDMLVSKGGDYQRDFFIVGKDDRILYSKVEAHIGEPLEHFYENLNLSGENKNETGQFQIVEKEQKNYFVNYVDSGTSGWRYLYLTDMQIYQERVSDLFYMGAVVFILVTLISVLVAYLISMKVFLPVKNIIEMMDDPTEFYQMNTKSSDNNELKYIITSFMNNVTQQEKSREELTKYVTKLKETQVSLLQTQINPHFLFNTFQSINFMAMRMTKSDNEVSKAIEKLSTILRSIMEVEHNLVTVAQEIHYSKAYIALEQLRFQNEFGVYWRISDEIQEYLVAKISLQPLLENCIRHGFRNKKAGEEIIIEGRKIENNLYLTVTDNGQSQEVNWMDAMNRELENFDAFVGEHIGIRNVNQRIKLLFGVDYGVRIFSVTNGFSIGIILPAVLKMDTES